MRLLGTIILAGLTLWCVGCAAVKPGPAPPPEPGAAFIPGRTTPLDQQRLGQLVSAARLVMVGESHRHPGHHAIQARILELAALGRDPAQVVVGVEWLDQTKQPVCDQLSAGRLTVDQFAEQALWDNDWGYDLALYRPILEQVRQRGYRLVALNAPAPIIRQIGRQGLGSLGAQQRAAIAPALWLDDPAYRRQVAEQMPMHGQLGSAGLDNFFAAQVARDETMAHNMAHRLTPWPDGQAIGVVLVGAGHMTHGRGLPPRLARRLPGAPPLRVMPIEPAMADQTTLLFQADYADVLIVSTPEPPRPPRLGVVLEPEPGGGLRVRAVLPGSAAAEAGLLPGDVLLSVNGRPLGQAKDIHDAVKGEPGKKHVFRVRRGEKTIDLMIGPRPM